MNELEDIIAQNSEKQQKEQDRKALASDIGSQFGSHFQKSTAEIQKTNAISSDQLARLEKEMDWKFTKLLAAFSVKMDEIITKIRDIKIEVPDVVMPEIKIPHIDSPEVRIPPIKVPEIKIPDVIVPEIKVPEIKIPKIDTPIVPKPEVTVNVPQPRVTVRPNIVVRSPQDSQPRVVEEKEIYREGFLDGWERKYDNGQIIKMTGASIGKRKYEYR
jgi:hypothetical protein